MEGTGDKVIVSGNAVLPKSQRTFNHYFNTSVYALPAVGQLVINGPRRSTVPGMNNWDYLLNEEFRDQGEGSAQLRFEAYNAFNHTQFSSVNASATFNPTTGQQVNSAFGKLPGDFGARNHPVGIAHQFLAHSWGPRGRARGAPSASRQTAYRVHNTGLQDVRSF